jgi:pimeloyl-ACP methyl ester carboxylesterase
MRTRMLEIEGHRLAVISDNEDQSGPPVVLIHGITASVDFWLPTLPDVIRRKFCWHSLSLPGHAPSTMPPCYQRNDITAAMFSRVLGEAVHSLTGGAPAHLVGWSTGGFSVVAIAASRPELAKSVVSFSGFAAGRWGGTIGALQILANSSPLGRLIARRIFRALGRNTGLHEFIALRGAAHPRSVQQTTAWRDTFPSLHDGMARHDPAVLTDLFIRLRSLNIADQLPKIAAPVLIAGGNRDPFVPFSQTELLAGQIPRAELAVLDGFGHMFFAECTDRYHQLLTDWLSRQDAVANERGDPTGKLSTGAAV